MNCLWSILILTNSVLIRVKTPGPGDYWLLGSQDLVSWTVLASGVEQTAVNVCVKVQRKEREFFAVSWKGREL